MPSTIPDIYGRQRAAPTGSARSRYIAAARCLYGRAIFFFRIRPRRRAAIDTSALDDAGLPKFAYY